MMPPVAKPVRRAVDAEWTISDPRIVHNFAALHPLETAVAVLTGRFWIPDVMARGYNAIHTVHSSY
jgi:hypothetical protein